MKLDQIKIGIDLFGFNHVNDLNNLYQRVNRVSQAYHVPGNRLIVPVMRTMSVDMENRTVTNQVEQLEFPIKSTTSVPFIIKDLNDELRKNPEQLLFSTENVVKCLNTITYRKNKTPYIFKGKDELFIVSLDDITLHVCERNASYSNYIYYAIANTGAIVYHLKEEVKVLTSLEKEINDLNQIGYRE